MDARFRTHLDHDLLVEGLTPDGMLKAIALTEAAGPMAVDLKRKKDLSDDLLQRLPSLSQHL